MRCMYECKEETVCVKNNCSCDCHSLVPNKNVNPAADSELLRFVKETLRMGPDESWTKEYMEDLIARAEGRKQWTPKQKSHS